MKRWSWLLLLVLTGPAFAQGRDSALSDSEVESIRERAPDPAARVQVFLTILDDRTKAIDKLVAGRRKPGREEDLHDLMDQFNSIAEDLQDNLDDYAKRHRDLRRILPKLLGATERWATALRSPADDGAYRLVRNLALEAVADLRETATTLETEQKAYFLAHPPAKDDPRRDGSALPGREF